MSPTTILSTYDAFLILFGTYLPSRVLISCRRKKRNAAATYASEALKFWNKLGVIDFAPYFYLKMATAACATGK